MCCVEHTCIVYVYIFVLNASNGLEHICIVCVIVFPECNKWVYNKHSCCDVFLVFNTFRCWDTRVSNSKEVQLFQGIKCFSPLAYNSHIYIVFFNDDLILFV